jgi:hypothetical protein
VASRALAAAAAAAVGEYADVASRALAAADA